MKNVISCSDKLNADELVDILKRLSKICWHEIVHQPSEANKRLSILKLVAALALKHGGDGVILTNLYMLTEFPH